MLQHLTIRNLAIIAHADLTFKQGMTVITGETGAGKSIILNALNLILGHRAESSLIQPSMEKAEICATFSINHLPSAVLWLNDLDLQNEDNQSCILRRVIYQNGRSRSYINGTPCTSSQLKMLGEFLVQMHGQHKHQLLLQPREQLRILDFYGKLEKEVEALKTIYYKIETLIEQKEKRLSDGGNSYQVELLNYQIEELEVLNLQKNELAALYQEHDRLAQAENTLDACNDALNALDSEAQGNALQLVSQARKSIAGLVPKFEALQNVSECIDHALIHLNETISELSAFISTLEIDPDKLNTIIQRLDKIHDIARKHKIEPEQLSDYYIELKQKYEDLSQHSQTQAELDKQIHLLEKQYIKLANQLSQKRKKAALKLETVISKQIQTLAMQGAEFKVQCDASASNSNLSPNGLDEVCFCISANAGHPPKPIHKVASGGELSRISLALELATLKDLTAPALIFDEIDVGIGGKTGAIIGQNLHQLSQNQQVICITHLPQVAAFGDHHFFVSKQKIDDQTQTCILSLDSKERVDEIARMLGGIEISAQARAQAKHLLKKETLAIG